MIQPKGGRIETHEPDFSFSDKGLRVKNIKLTDKKSIFEQITSW